MISKPIFFVLFFVELVRAFGLINYDINYEMTSCTKVLIREFGERVNFRIAQISTITNCPKGYNANSTVRIKCETASTLPKTAILEDTFIFTLALDRANRSMLYSNVYCAICNGEREFYQFPPYFHYQLHNESNVNISDSMSLEENRKYYPVSEHTFLLGNLKANKTSNELISYNKIGLKYKFVPYRVLVIPKRSKIMFREPMLSHHSFRIPFCQDSPLYNFECDLNFTKIKDCYYDDGVYSNIFNSQHAILNLNKEHNRTANASFCPERNLDAGSDSSCQYEDQTKGFICWWNRFLKKGAHYVDGENGEIFIVDDHIMMNMSRDEYTVETGSKDVIYLCGVDIQEDHENKYCIEIINSIQCVLRRFSLFCIIVYLLINGRCGRLSNLVDKITYSYYATLLLMYCREEISDAISKKVTCFLNYTAYRYLLLSYVFWIAIGTWYLWFIIQSPGAESALNNTVIKRRLIYLSMCGIGWVLPAVIGMIFYALEPIPPCPIMRGYHNQKLCRMSDEPDAYYWFIFVTVCIIGVIVSVQFSTACYHYQFSKMMQDEDDGGYADWPTRMVFFFKIVYSIGLYLMLLVTSMLNRRGAMYSILLHLWSFHGTLIFFLYSFKMTVMKVMTSKRGLPEGAAAADQPINERRSESKETAFVDSTDLNS